MLFLNLTCVLKAMVQQRFRTATQGLGRFHSTRNELRIRKGSKLYLFACMEHELRFEVTGRAALVIPLAPDATVNELRRSIASLIEEN